MVPRNKLFRLFCKAVKNFTTLPELEDFVRTVRLPHEWVLPPEEENELAASMQEGDYEDEQVFYSDWMQPASAPPKLLVTCSGCLK